MTIYKVLWDSQVLKDLKKLDKKIAINIINKVSNYLANDPIHLGKQLSGNFHGLMRYRFGDYRIIYTINHSEIVIEIIRIGHRKEIMELLLQNPLQYSEKQSREC